MTIEQIVCVSIGFIFEAGTFALGLLVGASLRRRDSTRETEIKGTDGSFGD